MESKSKTNNNNNKAKLIHRGNRLEVQSWGMGEKGEGIVSLSKNSKQNKKFKSETKTFMFSGLVNGVLMTGPNMVT